MFGLGIWYQVWGILASLAAVVTITGVWWARIGRERWHKAKQFTARWVETVNGREAEEDAYGHETSPAILPLSEQQAVTQRQIGELTAAVQTLVKHADEISEVKARLSSVEHDVADLKQARIERTLTKAEAIAAWRAIEAAHGSTPPPTELEH